MMKSGVEQGCKDFRGLLRRAKIIHRQKVLVFVVGVLRMITQEKKTTTLVLLLLMAMGGGLGGRCGTVNLCSLEKGNVEKPVLLSLKTRTHDETLVENSACCECGRAKISFFFQGVESTTGGEKWVCMDACWLFRSRAAVVVALMTRRLEQSVLVTGTCF